MSTISSVDTPTIPDLQAIAKSISPSIYSETLALLQEHYLLPESDLHERGIVANFLRSAAQVMQTAAYARLQAREDMPRHCVRCHAEYKEGTNNKNACIIPHVFSSDGEWHGKDRGGTIELFPSLCCGRAVTVTSENSGMYFRNLDRLTNCFEGRHTDECADVKYDYKGNYNGKNVRKCHVDESGQCVRKVVKRCNLEPCFDGTFDVRDKDGKFVVDSEDERSDDEENEEEDDDMDDEEDDGL